MSRRTANFQIGNTHNCESNARYWSILQGEFPWCLDDSEETETPNDLPEGFDLIIAQPPRLTKSSGARTRNAITHSRPDINWIAYAEVFLRPGGTLLIFSPLEAIGAYAEALNSAKLRHQSTYIWQPDDATPALEAIIWASKESEDKQLQPVESKFLQPPAEILGSDQRRLWLIETLLENFTQQDMTVLEPFTNSNHVLLTCQKLHRFGLGVVRRRSQFKQLEQALESFSNNLKRTA